MVFFLPFSLDFSCKFGWNEHFRIKNIVNVPKISLTTKDIQKILSKKLFSAQNWKRGLNTLKSQMRFK